MRFSSQLGERIARHGLAPRRATSVAEAAALTCAIQAQDPAASRLGIRVRCERATEADVVHAIGVDRSVTRTWLLRGTIHLVDTADLRWLVRVVGPALLGKFRTRWQQLGLTERVLDRTATHLQDVLAGEPMTRSQIQTGLIGVAPKRSDPQLHAHVLLHASAIGLVCRAHDRGREATFTLLDDWARGSPEGPSDDDALAALARRYFAAFSPATPIDFTTWSGLGASRAIELIRDELTPVEVGGRPGFRLGEREPARGVTLLPAFDNYLLGYRDRDEILAGPLRGRIYAGGLIHPSVLVDGRVVGRWRLVRSRDPVHVTVAPFERLTRRVQRGVESEAADIGRFLDRSVALEIGEVG